ncbi:MAG TPA: tRNA 2-thiouridine(34) synthase MnmA [Acholeplasmataceae bacterium]|nr:tRNA 2-thiouridine(34) synthase MnmA [Acholeplasmataceae bacterium]HBO67832.1 tRNA 2-thiouridine(34) synthase MnmA [Acholeplasmataceae bacterium]HBS02160.1 tRNA 2-thiouridine(34) synthase MnmA [Acholeplasmataceae bacterium]HCB20993.1 tRNA 2-thiouridine(34) synthase MnmA [Acholeplasmataceae bacterium]
MSKESDVMKKEKVIIGLSGGVDSSVAAYLLIKDGYDVEAVFMRNWDSATNRDIKGNPTVFDEVCEQEKDYQDAKAVADKLGIILHKVDFIEDYWDRVFSYFLDEYKKNRTPNPDVLCNNEIKFKAFVDYVKKFDADYIAMGHYAQIDLTGNYPRLLRAIDQNKDQTYFLSQLKEEQLKNVMFPIGHLDKKEVRKIALEQDLITATKKDSTGICFIGERHFADFLSNYLPAQKGLMKRLDGTVIKEHFGLMNYTIGQRKGLGIGGSKDELSAWYVVGKDLKTNTLLVEPGFHHPHLYSDEALITDVVWRGPKTEGNITAKFRYRQPDQDVSVTWVDENTIKVAYPQTIRAVTPGQVCAFYQGDVCVGSGFISEVYMEKKRRQYS